MAAVQNEPVQPLPPQRLYTPCDVSQFGFHTTDDIDDLSEFIGQPRAASSLEFAVGMRRHGYNLFVMGSAGAGKHAMVGQFLAEHARRGPHPSDWVYVNNFQHPHKPLALELSAGRGSSLRVDMQRFIDELRIAVPAMFDSDEYRARGERIDGEFSERHEKAFGELSEEAATHNVTLLRTQTGFSLAPMKEGEVISAEDYTKLGRSEARALDLLHAA